MRRAVGHAAHRGNDALADPRPRRGDSLASLVNRCAAPGEGRFYIMGRNVVFKAAEHVIVPHANNLLAETGNFAKRPVSISKKHLERRGPQLKIG